jgi:hypothetical protein
MKKGTRSFIEEWNIDVGHSCNDTNMENRSTRRRTHLSQCHLIQHSPHTTFAVRLGRLSSQPSHSLCDVFSYTNWHDVLEGAAAFSGQPDYARHILKCGILYKKYVVPANDMKAYTQRVGAATLILNPGTRCRWVIRITLCPLYLRRLGEPQSLSRRSGGNISYSHGHSACGYSTPQWSLSHIVHFYETAVK